MGSVSAEGIARSPGSRFVQELRLSDGDSFSVSESKMKLGPTLPLAGKFSSNWLGFAPSPPALGERGQNQANHSKTVSVSYLTSPGDSTRPRLARRNRPAQR